MFVPSVVRGDFEKVCGNYMNMKECLDAATPACHGQRPQCKPSGDEYCYECKADCETNIALCNKALNAKCPGLTQCYMNSVTNHCFSCSNKIDIPKLPNEYLRDENNY
jgi:hypothetical protein